jgi:hypothetical protein
MAILPERFHLHQTLYPKYQTTVDGTANLSLQGYVVANPVNGEGQVPGQFRLTFSGVIDKYHSAILAHQAGCVLLASATIRRTLGTPTLRVARVTSWDLCC